MRGKRTEAQIVISCQFYISYCPGKGVVAGDRRGAVIILDDPRLTGMSDCEMHMVNCIQQSNDMHRVVWL